MRKRQGDVPTLRFMFRGIGWDEVGPVLTIHRFPHEIKYGLQIRPMCWDLSIAFA